MKILFVSDYITDFPEIPDDLSLIVLLGDLKPEDLFWLNDINVPKIGVYGNHCVGNYFEQYNIKNMHLKTENINGLNFFGLEGCVKYKEDDRQYTQSEYKKMMDKFQGADIFLSHCPPEGINDNPQDSSHLGIESITPILNSVGLFVHGHSYPKTKWSVYNKTWVLYVHGYEVVDLKEMPDRSTLPKASSYGDFSTLVSHITALKNFLED